MAPKSDPDDSGGMKEKHFFKNIVYLPEERVFHGVIDRSDNPTDGVHYKHYTFEMSADFQTIVAGQIECFGALDRDFVLMTG